MKLTPNASIDRLLGIAADVDGTLVLRAQVTAVPEDGKANAALIALLAKRWRLPKSTISVVRGVTSRRKLVAVAGDPARLHLHLSSRMGSDG